MTRIALGMVLLMGVATTLHAEKKEKHPVYDLKMKTLAGKEVSLSKYKGKVLLVVNTASECGATPQYETLQQLHSKYHDRGLEVIGFPCNQFGTQEPGTNDEIAAFCKQNYGVSFDMFAKIDVNGEKATDLFKFLTAKDSGLKNSGPVKWNFEKFLISRDGKLLARFGTSVEPTAPEVVDAIEGALKK